MLAEGVLARRPGDLRAMWNLPEAKAVLALIAAEGFQEAEAQRLNSEGQRAAENYVRFNPSGQSGWTRVSELKQQSAELAFRLGYVPRALQKARAGMKWRPKQLSTNLYNDLDPFWMSREITEWEAQRGNRDTAEKTWIATKGCAET